MCRLGFGRCHRVVNKDCRLSPSTSLSSLWFLLLAYIVPAVLAHVCRSHTSHPRASEFNTSHIRIHHVRQPLQLLFVATFDPSSVPKLSLILSAGFPLSVDTYICVVRRPSSDLSCTSVTGRKRCQHTNRSGLTSNFTQTSTQYIWSCWPPRRRHLHANRFHAIPAPLLSLCCHRCVSNVSNCNR